MSFKKVLFLIIIAVTYCLPASAMQPRDKLDKLLASLPKGTVLRFHGESFWGMNLWGSKVAVFWEFPNQNLQVNNSLHTDFDTAIAQASCTASFPALSKTVKKSLKHHFDIDLDIVTRAGLDFWLRCNNGIGIVLDDQEIVRLKEFKYEDIKTPASKLEVRKEFEGQSVSDVIEKFVKSEIH